MPRQPRSAFNTPLHEPVIFFSVHPALVPLFLRYLREGSRKQRAVYFHQTGHTPVLSFIYLPSRVLRFADSAETNW